MIRQFEAQERRRAALDAQLAHSARLVSLGRMAAGVAHEINNPLAAIGELAGLVEDLMDEELVKASPNGELFRDNIIKIQQHVDRARGVTHRLLGFARRMEPHWDMVDINQVLKETYSFLEKEAMFRGVQVTLDLEAGLSLMKSDQAQLQQVFLNLLDNALDAVKSGGHVTIRSRRNGDGARVTFADDGPGVPPDCRDRIFDPFFTTKAPGEGSGLGLSISYSIMQKLGGDLRLLPDGGPGAVFEVNVSPAGE
jgi:two-component system NtrC family sensor kinase